MADTIIVPKTAPNGTERLVTERPGEGGSAMQVRDVRCWRRKGGEEVTARRDGEGHESIE